MVAGRIFATYTIETSRRLDEAAAAMAGEQSTGTFIRLEREAMPSVDRQSAHVESIEALPDAAGDARYGNGADRPRLSRGEVVISWPSDNFGPSLPNLISTVAGNHFELNELHAIRLTAISVPQTFMKAYKGPAFGVSGTRRLSGCEHGPLVGTIIKPSVGLSAAETADLAAELALAGIDFIKDDELQSDGPYCPFADRVRLVMRRLNRIADRTGRKAMYAFNLTGDIDEMRRRHDLVLAEGGTCVMVSLLSVGVAGLAHLRSYSELPIHGHRNGWGLYYRSPQIGIDYGVYQQIWRMAGADHLHVNGLRSKFAEADESVTRSARACLSPLFEDQPLVAMPVFSSGQTVFQVARTYAAVGSTDLIYCCGGGIAGHPGGVGAGVDSIRQAWDAAIAGQRIEDRARQSGNLAQALEFFS